MNKEEIEDLQNIICKLSEENNKLKDRINKAIEYIDKIFIYKWESCFFEEDRQEVFKILKGEK